MVVRVVKKEVAPGFLSARHAGGGKKWHNVQMGASAGTSAPEVSAPKNDNPSVTGSKDTDTFDYSTLKSGDKAPDGMIVVGRMKTGKLLLREEFKEASWNEFDRRARNDVVHGHQPGTTSLPNNDQADLILFTLSDKENKKLNVIWLSEYDFKIADVKCTDGGYRSWSNRNNRAPGCLVREL